MSKISNRIRGALLAAVVLGAAAVGAPGFAQSKSAFDQNRGTLHALDRPPCIDNYMRQRGLSHFILDINTPAGDYGTIARGPIAAAAS